ncbi:uncharacterized protein [Panulirus ornatus]|uniref:uncharacterized protein n=1 Tax=Panulirus ornatus TaxID=150431 RepID=UPI003A89593B
MDKIGEWQIEKYARTTVRASEEGKAWETLDNTPTRPLVLILTKGGILKVLVGRFLLEYWNLLHVKDMKTHTLGDSMLFLCKAKVEMRKWRIRFAGGAVVGEERCSSCARAVDAFLISTIPILQPQASSLPRLQPALPPPSQTGFQPVFPASSASGLQPAPLASWFTGLQPFPLPIAPALPRQPVPILAVPPVTQQPSVALSHASGIHEFAQDVSQERNTAPSPIGVSSSIIAQGDPTLATTAVTMANYFTPSCSGYSVGKAVKTSDLPTGGKCVRRMTKSSSDCDATHQGSEAGVVGTESNPARVLHPPNLLEALGDSPSFEQVVRAVLQDPSLPDLVDAVHKVISNM